MFSSPHICLQLSFCLYWWLWVKWSSHVCKDQRVCFQLLVGSMFFSGIRDYTVHSNHDDVIASSAAPPNDALSVIFASACITHNALQKWCQKQLIEAVCVFDESGGSAGRVSDWLIDQVLFVHTRVFSRSGKAFRCWWRLRHRSCFLQLKDSTWRGGVRFRVSSDWIQLLISQLTSGQ